LWTDTRATAAVRTDDKTKHDYISNFERGYAALCAPFGGEASFSGRIWIDRCSGIAGIGGFCIYSAFKWISFGFLGWQAMPMMWMQCRAIQSCRGGGEQQEQDPASARGIP
jgi:hypothetical protein